MDVLFARKLRLCMLRLYHGSYLDEISGFSTRGGNVLRCFGQAEDMADRLRALGLDDAKLAEGGAPRWARVMGHGEEDPRELGVKL